MADSAMNLALNAVGAMIATTVTGGVCYGANKCMQSRRAANNNNSNNSSTEMRPTMNSMPHVERHGGPRPGAQNTAPAQAQPGPPAASPSSPAPAPPPKKRSAVRRRSTLPTEPTASDVQGGAAPSQVTTPRRTAAADIPSSASGPANATASGSDAHGAAGGAQRNGPAEAGTRRKTTERASTR